MMMNSKCILVFLLSLGAGCAADRVEEEAGSTGATITARRSNGWSPFAGRNGNPNVPIAQCDPAFPPSELERIVGAVESMEATFDRIESGTPILADSVMQVRGAGFHQLNGGNATSAIEFLFRTKTDEFAAYWSTDPTESDELMHVRVPEGLDREEGTIELFYEVLLTDQNCPNLEAAFKTTSKTVRWQGPVMNVEFDTNLPPTEVLDLRAIAIQTDKVRLLWSDADRELTYRANIRAFERGRMTPWKFIGELVKDSNEGLVEGLLPTTVYQFQIEACNQNGCVVSNLANATTPATSPTGPGPNPDGEARVTILDHSSDPSYALSPLTRDAQNVLPAVEVTSLFDTQRDQIVQDGTQNNALPVEWPLGFSGGGAVRGNRYANGANVVLAAIIPPTSGARTAYQYVAVHLYVENQNGQCVARAVSASGGDWGTRTDDRIMVPYNANSLSVTLTQCQLPGPGGYGRITGHANMELLLTESVLPAPGAALELAHYSSTVRIDFTNVVLFADG